MQQYTHLMLSGGGYLGYVYIGVYRFLLEHDMLKSIKYLYGTSIGAFFCFLFGLGISYERMEEIYMPGGSFANPGNNTYDPANFMCLPKEYGMFNGKHVRAPLQSILQEVFQVEDITFQDYLKKTGKDLHINATCLDTCESVDFCSDTHPTMSVLTAIEASTAIPVLFKPVLYKGKYYVDGATMNNLPLHLLPPHPGHKALAFNIHSWPSHTPITNFMSYMMKVCISLMQAPFHIEVKNKHIDLINFDKIPISACSLHPIDNKYLVSYTKEEIESTIYYAYETTYKFFFTNSTSASGDLSPSNGMDLPPASSST